MKKINVLDHGFVRHVDSMGGDISVVRSARVSYDAAPRAGNDKGSDARLLAYLMRNGHTTPFESVTFTFEVMAPIFVLRQWMRHRTQSYNELSARYRPLPELFYVPEPHLIGAQSEDNKQMRTVLTKEEFESLPQEKQKEAIAVSNTIRTQCELAFAAYRELMARKVPRELARGVLPVHTYSHMFTTMNLHNLSKFLVERLHPHAQYEIRVYAEAMLEMIREVVPLCAAGIDELIKAKISK